MNFFTPVIDEHIKKSAWLAVVGQQDTIFFCRKCETLPAMHEKVERECKLERM